MRLLIPAAILSLGLLGPQVAREHVGPWVWRMQRGEVVEAFRQLGNREVAREGVRVEVRFVRPEAMERREIERRVRRLRERSRAAAAEYRRHRHRHSRSERRTNRD